MGCKLAIVAPDLSHNRTLTVVTFDYFQLFFSTHAIKYYFPRVLHLLHFNAPFSL